jgi:hypothetical protein
MIAAVKLFFENILFYQISFSSHYGLLIAWVCLLTGAMIHMLAQVQTPGKMCSRKLYVVAYFPLICIIIMHMLWT